MMRAVLLVTLASTLLLFGPAGCGGSRRVTFSVDSAKPMSSLTAAELQTMCAEMMEGSQDTFDFICLMQGVGVKFQPDGSEQTCQAKVTSCKAELGSKTASCNLIKPEGLQNCAATVGEYQTCLNDGLAMIDKLDGKLSCSMSLSELMEMAEEMKSFQNMPPSCATIKAKCPGLGGDDDGSTPG